MTTRLGIVVALSLALAACGTSHTAGGGDGGLRPDAVEHCRERGMRVCARTFAIDRDEPAHMECVYGIDAMCRGASWPSGCAPAQDALDACLDALVDPARITVTPGDLPECASVCAP